MRNCESLDKIKGPVRDKTVKCKKKKKKKRAEMVPFFLPPIKGEDKERGQYCALFIMRGLNMFYI